MNFHPQDRSDSSESDYDFDKKQMLEDEPLCSSMPLPRDGCWDGRLRGVTVSTTVDQLAKYANKCRPEVRTEGCLQSTSLAQLAWLVDKLEPPLRAPRQEEFDEEGEEEDDAVEDEENEEDEDL